jgi:hypothetical protein
VCKMIKLEHILKSCVSVVNFILVRKLCNRQFTFFLDIKSEYKVFQVTA